MTFQIISNVSAIATLILFVLYFVGKVMKITRLKSTLCEVYQMEDEIQSDAKYTEKYVDIAGGEGAYFSVSSPNGFKSVSFYYADLDIEGMAHKGKLAKTFKDVLPNEKVYACVMIPDTSEACFVEIEKNDYVQISFGIEDRMIDGALYKSGYKMKMTLKSWIYYLCS